LGDLSLRRELGHGDLDIRRGQLGVSQGQLGLANTRESRLNDAQKFNQGLQSFLTNTGLLGF
jgi:hypothetical protein